MSHNLVLRSIHDEFPLVQTPTDVTRAAFSSGSDTAIRSMYERWLRECSDLSCDDDSVPGLSLDPVTRHIMMIDAFLAFAPGARFYST